MTPIRRFGWTALALSALVGCEAPAPPVTPPAAGGTTGTTVEPKPPTDIKPMPVEESKPKEGASVDKLTDQELAAIKKLPADEQPIAIAQMVCPVSEHHLGGGGMGVPIKQTIGDKTFYVCCAGCKDDVKDDPAAVLAKLAKLKK